jgi:hypothetical protein
MAKRSRWCPIKNGIELFAMDNRIDVHHYLEANVIPKLKRLWKKAKRKDPWIRFQWLNHTLYLMKGDIATLPLTLKIEWAALRPKTGISAVAIRRPALVKVFELLSVVASELHRELKVEEIDDTRDEDEVGASSKGTQQRARRHGKQGNSKTNASRKVRHRACRPQATR